MRPLAALLAAAALAAAAAPASAGGELRSRLPSRLPATLPGAMPPTPDLSQSQCPVPCTNRFDHLFRRAAREYGRWGEKRDWCALKAQACAESRIRPDVCSPADACGVMQLLSGTARDLRVRDRFDPRESIDGGARYMRWLCGQWIRYGRTRGQILELCRAAYNWGLGNVLKCQREWGGILAGDFLPPCAPEETTTYYRRIARLECNGGPW